MKKKRILLVIGFTVACLISCSKDPVLEQQVGEIAATTTQQTLSTTTNFYYGVNGQPLSSVYPYNEVSPENQIKLIKSLGMNIYRFHAAFQVANGNFTVPYLYRPLKAAAAAEKVTLLPYFDIRTLSFSRPKTTNFNEAREFGKLIGKVNGADFDYYEIGNELDNQCIIRGKNYAGDQLSHYDPDKLLMVMAAVKGMIDGIKQTDPTAKVIVNCSWMHYAFMDYLLKNQARIDIIGWHWYGDMEKAAKATYGINDITQFLANKYRNKIIWFTEFNLKGNADGTPMNEQDQQAFINSFLAKCKNNSRVGAALIWELFDQPQRSAAERNYGIITYVSNTSTNMSPKIYAETTSTLF